MSTAGFHPWTFSPIKEALENFQEKTEAKKLETSTLSVSVVTKLPAPSSSGPTFFHIYSFIVGVLMQALALCCIFTFIKYIFPEASKRWLLGSVVSFYWSVVASCICLSGTGQGWPLIETFLQLPSCQLIVIYVQYTWVPTCKPFRSWQEDYRSLWQAWSVVKRISWIV